MKDNTKKLYFVILLLVILIGGLSYNFIKLGIPYYIIVIIISILISLLFVYFKISQLHFYKELTDETFIQYKNLFLLYKSRVLEKNQRYDIFVYEYCNSNVRLAVKTYSNGGISSTDYNTKNNTYNQIKYILENRFDLIEKYFHQDTFNYQDYINLILDYKSTNSPSENEDKSTTIESQNFKFYNLDDERISVELKQFVLDCYGDKGVKHHGDRNFGYFIRHKHPAYSTVKQYTEAWNQYIGEYEPRDNCKYIGDPSYWKNETEIEATLKSLEKSFNFYSAFMSDDSPIIKNIQKDMKYLSELKDKSIDR